MLVADANRRTSAQIMLEDMREAISHITSETSFESIPGPNVYTIFTKGLSKESI